MTDIQKNKGRKGQDDYVDQLNKSGFDYSLVQANTFVQGMREIGYKSNATALNELIDNGYQSGASDIHVAFGYPEKDKSQKKPNQIAVIDNGHGMSPGMLRASVIWGGTHRHDDRAGFGRFGYGLPSASISIGVRYTVYSLTAGGEWNGVTIDLDDINQHFKDGKGHYHVPEAQTMELPKWLLNHIGEHMPKLKSGTVVLIEKPDRLQYKTTDKLQDFLLREFGVSYRNYIAQAKIVVGGVNVDPIDPLFLTPGALYYDVNGMKAEALPELKFSVTPEQGGGPVEVRVRFSYMPVGFWKNIKEPRFKTRKAYNGINICRLGRHIDVINSKCPFTQFQNNDRHLGIEVDFPPELDGEFSITTAKQQIVIRDRMWDILEENGLNDAITQMRNRNKVDRASAKQEADDPETSRPSEEAVKGAVKLTSETEKEPTEEQELANERDLKEHVNKISKATGLTPEKAKELHEQQAIKRPYVVDYENTSTGAPFFRLHRIGGQLILYINKDHLFYTHVYAHKDSNPYMRQGLEVMMFTWGFCERKAAGDTAVWYEFARGNWSARLQAALPFLEKHFQSSDAWSSAMEELELAAEIQESEQSKKNEKAVA